MRFKIGLIIDTECREKYKNIKITSGKQKILSDNAFVSLLLQFFTLNDS